MIIGSPFRVNVRDRLDANRVNVKMSPTMRANVLQEILIDGQSAGPGSPSVDITDIHGRSFLSLITTKKRSYNQEKRKQYINSKVKMRIKRTCIYRESNKNEMKDRRYHHYDLIEFH